ncbi:MAG: CDGSH iron-sulfur domain-containing protein [Chloroflexota bacterium]|nr:CDGSH iron-sulfur domain-containing protein [Chloroflexota bacterium]
MPKHHTNTYKSHGHIRTRVKMRKGEVISLCRCWQSKNFPLCDGTHNTLDNDRGPAVIQIDCDLNFLDQEEE